MESGRKKSKKSMGLADRLQKRADVGAVGLMVIERGEKDGGGEGGGDRCRQSTRQERKTVAEEQR